MVACHLKGYRPDLGYKMITGKAYKDVVQHLFTCFSYLRGPLRTMPGGGSAPSCCAFTHRVAFEEGSGPRVLLKGGPGNRGRSVKLKSLWAAVLESGPDCPPAPSGQRLPPAPTSALRPGEGQLLLCTQHHGSSPRHFKRENSKQVRFSFGLEIWE